MNVPYKLFLDDDCLTEGAEAFRRPPEGEDDWRLATSTAEAIQLVINYGVPFYMCLDHDLGVIDGETDTTMNFLSWLFQMFPDAIDEIKDWNVHSMNPAGADNINAFMRSWRRSRYLR